MAFGIKRNDLTDWKERIRRGEIAFLTHYWIDDRFPGCTTVTKVGCKDLKKLADWGEKYGLKPEWIDRRRQDYPHFDLFGYRQASILKAEGLENRLEQHEKK